jgi:hypothetical protein
MTSSGLMIIGDDVDSMGYQSHRICPDPQFVSNKIQTIGKLSCFKLVACSDKLKLTKLLCKPKQIMLCVFFLNTIKYYFYFST